MSSRAQLPSEGSPPDAVNDVLRSYGCARTFERLCAFSSSSMAPMRCWASCTGCASPETSSIGSGARGGREMVSKSSPAANAAIDSIRNNLESKIFMGPPVLNDIRIQITFVLQFEDDGLDRGG